ncbi:MAG: hypothetical protein NZ455_07040 [Bacteroidia bacterium]|nr:hypothetical protein [Bacteroidia bacterium]MDW8345398.1 hypothetical protein [Bacteroidia bacterium]
MHFSDCDNLFCEKNNLSKPQWRQLLQQKIEQEVIEALSYQYTAISLYLSPNPEDQQLFKDWHKLKFCLYKESTPTRLEESKNLETNYIKFINWIKKNTAFGQEKNSLCWQENLKETKYILAYPRRHNLMDSIAQIFEVEKILLLTQVEIKTNYHTCIATDGTQFDRSIKLHYCLYNAKNEFLYGDVAVSKGQSKTTELQSFFQEHLGYLGYYILSTVEKK